MSLFITKTYNLMPLKLTISLLSFIFLLSCNQLKDNTDVAFLAKSSRLNLIEANRLAQLPLNCIDNEYPYKLGQTLVGPEDLLSPKILHPSFYGCFDWHSAVHGHWSLVCLLKQFPALENNESIKLKLLESISEINISKEVAYFDGVHNASFERTYGWAWLLKLADELHTWEDPVAKKLEENLKPLTNLIVSKYISFLPKLNYPIRVGEHSNTAFGLSFAWDYANTVGADELMSVIRERAKDFYLNDKNCPIIWEPGGYDFLSPCLEEAALMKRILSPIEFNEWIKGFLPQLKDPNFSLEPGIVSDRTDGKLVHLDGLNFSRAWSLNAISKDIKSYSHLINIANSHIDYSLPSIVGDSYEGGHWLASFAIYALNSIK